MNRSKRTSGKYPISGDGQPFFQEGRRAAMTVGLRDYMVEDAGDSERIPLKDRVRIYTWLGRARMEDNKTAREMLLEFSHCKRRNHEKLTAYIESALVAPDAE